MNRKFAIGCCLVLLFVAIIVGTLIITAPRLGRIASDWISTNTEEVNRLAALEKKWQPPSESIQTDWFPPRLGEWSLEGASKIGAVSELKLTRAAGEATYLSSKGRRVKVTVVPVSKTEKQTVVDDTAEMLRKEESGSSVTKVVDNDRAVIRTSRTRVWWIKEWLLMFRSATEDPREFAEAFMAATSSSRLPDASEPLERPAAQPQQSKGAVR
jgi:hypothetical protein